MLKKMRAWNRPLLLYRLQALLNSTNARVLIHGHTHRQAIHKIETKGIVAKRIVLGDWYERDSILIYNKNNFRFERVENYITNN